jgi:predicted membrane chloride channel (bestrophin family)
MRQAILWIPDASLKRSLVRYIVAFSKTLKWHLGHQGNDRLLEEDLNDVLASEEMSKLLLSKNRVQHTVMRIAETISRANLVPNAQSHMDKGLCELSDAMYSCDRIYTSPIPLMYTRHTARFLLMWLLTVPMALYYEFRNSNIPYLWLYVPLITFVHSIFLFGIEELGVQIEEPFSILPLANICTNIKNLGVELLQDIGLDISPPKTTNSSIQQTTPSPEMIMSPTSEMGGLNTTQLSNFHVNGEPLSINQTDVATAPPIPTQPSEAHLEIYHNLLI